MAFRILFIHVLLGHLSPILSIDPWDASTECNPPGSNLIWFNWNVCPTTIEETLTGSILVPDTGEMVQHEPFFITIRPFGFVIRISCCVWNRVNNHNSYQVDNAAS